LVHGYAEYILEPKIKKWRANCTWPLAKVPIHLLASRSDWKMALWMLASFHHATAHRWTVVLHEDGTLRDTEISTIQNIFPSVRIWRRKEADHIMSTKLAKYPQCLAYRNSMPHALKVFDIPQLTDASRLLLSDPDVLFFTRPEKLMCWVQDQHDDSCWFNKDFQEPSPIPADVVMKEYGFRLWKRVNSGLCLLNTEAVNDLAAMERWLQNPLLQQPHIQWRVEQTLLALGASRANRGGLLPPEYEVSSARNRNPLAITRHYVGCVRDRFHSEGLISLRGMVKDLPPRNSE
jgi:hypothetical protein